MLRKAYSLEFIVRSIRRALPYANMRKAFSLKRNSVLIIKMLLVSAAVTVTAESFVPDFDNLSEIMVLTPSYPGWRGRFCPDGEAVLSYSGGDPRYLAKAPEASFTFKETYSLVAPHLKQGGYRYINELGEALVIRFYFGLDDIEGKEFYIDDKETMRKLMHNLCDTAVPFDKEWFASLLRKYPIVPGDPPYLKEEDQIKSEVRGQKSEGEEEVIGDEPKEEIKEEVIGDKLEVKEEVAGDQLEVTGAGTGEEMPSPVAARKTNRPSLLFSVGAGILVCVGAALFLTRKG